MNGISSHRVVSLFYLHIAVSLLLRLSVAPSDNQSTIKSCAKHSTLPMMKMFERTKHTHNPQQSVSHRLDTQTIRLQRNKFRLSIFSIDFYVVIQQSITGNAVNSSINSMTPIFAVKPNRDDGSNVHPTFSWHINLKLELYLT